MYNRGTCFSLFDFTIQFMLETNALGSAMGVILLQNGHPIAFFSKPFCPHLQCALMYDHELHVITTIVHK